MIHFTQSSNALHQSRVNPGDKSLMNKGLCKLRLTYCDLLFEKCYSALYALTSLEILMAKKKLCFNNNTVTKQENILNVMFRRHRENILVPNR